MLNPVSTSAPLTASPGPNGAPNCRPRASKGTPVKPRIGFWSFSSTAQRVTVVHNRFCAHAVRVISAESPTASRWVESTSHSTTPRFARANRVTVSVRHLSSVWVVSSGEPFGTSVAWMIGCWL